MYQLAQKTKLLWQRSICTIAAILLIFSLGGCSQNWGWYVVNPATPSGQKNLKFLIDGLYYTLALSLTAICISIIVGLLIALPGLSTRRAPRSINRVYVELIRSIPLLVLILWVYYGLPQVAGIFRAGIQSINRGQYEAAASISLNYRDTMRYVILPQAIKRILPALGNQLVYMLKMSSLVSVIGMQELTRRANELVVTEYHPLEIYTILVLEYLVVILLVSAGVRWLEKLLKTAA